VRTAIDSTASAFFRWRSVRLADKTAIFLWLICLATLSAGAGADGLQSAMND
jgi:hypothetical protein